MALRIGIGMMISALMVPVSVLIMPFFGIIGPQLAAYAISAATIGEIVFWCGAAIAGRDTVRLLKSHGWRETPGLVLQALRTGELALDAPARATAA